MTRTIPTESTTVPVSSATTKKRATGIGVSQRRLQPDHLIQAHLYLVSWTSRKFFPYLQHADREDCEAVGRLALWSAAQHYDPTREKVFYSFALLCIRRDMFRWARTYRQEKNGGSAPLSLDTILTDKNGGNGAPIAESIADANALQPEEEALKATTLTQWAEVTSHLTPTQADVLRLYYGIGEESGGSGAQGRTFAHVGKCLGVTSQRVHQIHQTALNRLRADPPEALMFL